MMELTFFQIIIKSLIFIKIYEVQWSGWLIETSRKCLGIYASVQLVYMSMQYHTIMHISIFMFKNAFLILKFPIKNKTKNANWESFNYTAVREKRDLSFLLHIPPPTVLQSPHQSRSSSSATLNSFLLLGT